MTFQKVSLGTLTAQASEWPLNKNKQTLVFIHGAGFHSGFWLPQQPLSKHFNVLLLNLPGRRGSEPCTGQIEVYADAVLAALSELQQQTIVIGHSMGGAVVQVLMLHNPAWMQAAVLVSTGAKLKVAPVVNQLFAQGGGVFMQMFSQSGPGLSLQQVTELAKNMAKTETGLKDFFACNRFNMMALLPQITTPCLIVCGDKDLLTPEKYSHYLHQNISGSEFSLVKGAGHLLPWEDSNTFNLLISEFAQRYEPHTVPATD